MKIVAFIFARGGSKGLPGKNIRELNGKPLIAWSIEQALAVKQIDRVIVSTDDEQIASVAIQYGAEVPFMRPSELSGDNSPEWLAWRHALNYLSETDYGLPDVMLSVPATSPLRLPKDIENCIKEYEKGSLDVVITLKEAHRNPYFNMVKKVTERTYEIVNSNQKNITRRQDAPEIFDVTTVAYVANPLFVLKNDHIFKGRVGGVTIPPERALDIDTKFDFQMAEFFLSLRQDNNENN